MGTQAYPDRQALRWTEAEGFYARALATDPEILLLDEPFNSLDIKTRKYLRIEFKRIVEELGLTTIFVPMTSKKPKRSVIARRY